MRPAVLLLLAACEREQHHEPPPPPKPQPQPVAHDIAIVIDMSKSMEENDLLPDRLGAVRAALRALVTASPGDRFAIVAFAQTTKVMLPLTGDHRAIDAALADLNIGDVPELGTAMGDGLALAVDALKAATNPKVIVLVGDGENNWVTHYDPQQATALAHAAHIPVHAIMVGRPTDLFGGSASPKEFHDIAAGTDGTFAPANDVAELGRDLANIHDRLAAERK